MHTLKRQSHKIFYILFVRHSVLFGHAVWKGTRLGGEHGEQRLWGVDHGDDIGDGVEANQLGGVCPTEECALSRPFQLASMKVGECMTV